MVTALWVATFPQALPIQVDCVHPFMLNSWLYTRGTPVARLSPEGAPVFPPLKITTTRHDKKLVACSRIGATQHSLSEDSRYNLRLALSPERHAAEQRPCYLLAFLAAPAA